MKVLVYGVGVIGSLTVHELCKAGNDVTVIARGHWRQVLQEKGLRIRCGRKEWTEYPKVLSQYDGAFYDAVFSIMQNQQQEKMLETLAGIRCAYLVLTGNNLQSAQMQKRLQELGVEAEKVLFGFQISAGRRHEDDTEAVIFGKPQMTVGHLKKEMDNREKNLFLLLFRDSDMKLVFMDDMESWYACHAAFVLPIAYLAYSFHCDLRHSSMSDIRDYLQAGKEAYGFLKSIGMQIRPKGDEKNLEGIRGAMLTLCMWIAARTKLGELAVTDHCRNAVGEMQYLDECFQEMRKQNSAFRMPCFDALRSRMPSWSELHLLCDQKKDTV